jgi:hypothetical protein
VNAAHVGEDSVVSVFVALIEKAPALCYHCIFVNEVMDLCCVLCVVCCVLCVACCVLRVAYCVLRVACCVLRVSFRFLSVASR